VKVKVISGTLKGSVLKLPKAGLRPTQERVKKSIFDILGERVEGSEVLDLFAGAGNLGIEALSRGAAHATFVEWESALVRYLRQNLERLRLSGKATLLAENAFKAIRRLDRKGAKFDLVFVDPPYNIEVMTKFLRSLSRCDILKHSAILVVRHPTTCLRPKGAGPYGPSLRLQDRWWGHPTKQRDLPEGESLGLVRQERYGATMVSFFQMKPRLTEA